MCNTHSTFPAVWPKSLAQEGKAMIADALFATGMSLMVAP